MEKQTDRMQNPNEETAFIEVVAEGIEEEKWAESVETCDDKEDYNIDSKYKTKIIVETTDGYEMLVNIDNEKVEGEVVYVIKGSRGKYTVTFDGNGGQRNTTRTNKKKSRFWV